MEEVRTAMLYLDDEMKQLEAQKNMNNNLKILVIKRIAMNEDGTFGVLMEGTVPFALTLERPWRNNMRNVSCIPQGIYICEKYTSPKYGETFQVMNVQDRNYILFHKGNIDDDTHGCIIIGEQYESLMGKTAVFASYKGFSEFIEKTKDIQSFKLIIRNEYA